MIEIDSNAIFNNFLYGFFMALKSFWPVIVMLLCPIVFWGLIKAVFRHIADFLIVPNSERERKRTHKSINKAVDGVSTVIDIMSSGKEQ